MFLGIEIGGTKLQLAVGTADGNPFHDFRRLNVDPREKAAGIRRQIEQAGRELIARHHVERIGIGFGGPVDSSRGRTLKSHQIDGWDDFDLASWCLEVLGIPAIVGNDCDSATLAEARYGAGRGRRSVFYLTVGTGVGGGFVLDGKLLGEGRPASAEIGHLRPGLDATDPQQSVEGMASGWAIVNAARREVGSGQSPQSSDAAALLELCNGNLELLTGVMVGEAARTGNSIARRAVDRACRALGWAIAQASTLLAPEVVVIGGGVSLMGQDLFLQPVRQYARQYIFPPLANSLAIEPARLGEQVVVHGALALAAARPEGDRS